ncbi:hypothetical protein [Xanthobacter agilis]|jgi:hypothetical protein|uniref:Uncharacterized protein n=1 Tax=Xanthobacter agilis TaxID=47492 RepID=A0ABU0LAG0_XANAG|nr:hypothetical protein [Xanthobacter agilis]MDQ0504129.1 hypothetical protein [Xanthobacter agilis]
MKILGVLICLLCGGASSAFALSPDMTLDFTWIGTALCAPTPGSPEFQVENMPARTAVLRFVLIGPNGAELGGADVPRPVHGTVPRGTISFRAPCVGGMYTWTVEAVDAQGKPLGKAKLTRPFY